MLKYSVPRVVCRNAKKTMQHLSVVFHKFPSDPNQRKLWEEFAGKSGEAICSRHFDESCYFVNDVDLQQRRRLLRNCMKKIIKCYF